MSQRFRLISLAALLLLTIAAPRPEPAHAQNREVWAYFLGWYGSPSWDDGRLLDRPLIQNYESFDFWILEQQIGQAQSAGIDAFVMSWLGRTNNNITDVTFNRALDVAANKGFRIGASVDLDNPEFMNSEQQLIDEISYLIKERAHHPAYLRYNGKPVVYFWNQRRFPPETWARIRQQADPTRDAIWVSEGLSTAYIPTFDGLYLFNTAWSGNPASTAIQYRNATYGAGGTFYTPTVMPGWNEDAVAITQNRPNPTSPRDRNGGAFLRNSWAGATAANTDVIMIVSWNEYLENSHIEPSQAHGYTALDTLRPLIAAWKAGAPAPEAQAPAPSEESAAELAAGNPTGNPTGVTFTLGYNGNLRASANSGAGVLTTIPFQTTVDIVGRNGDSSWLQINYDGRSGWIASQLGTIDGNLSVVPVTQ